jgi:hypothetical protein
VLGKLEPTPYKLALPSVSIWMPAAVQIVQPSAAGRELVVKKNKKQEHTNLASLEALAGRDVNGAPPAVQMSCSHARPC